LRLWRGNVPLDRFLIRLSYYPKTGNHFWETHCRDKIILLLLHMAWTWS